MKYKKSIQNPVIFHSRTPLQSPFAIVRTRPLITSRRRNRHIPRHAGLHRQEKERKNHTHLSSSEIMNFPSSTARSTRKMPFQHASSLLPLPTFSLSLLSSKITSAASYTRVRLVRNTRREKNLISRNVCRDRARGSDGK